MSCGQMYKQVMVDQTPKFDNQIRKKRRKGGNQVMSKSGIIRPDKRYKAKFL